MVTTDKGTSWRVERIQVFPAKDEPGKTLKQATVCCGGVVGDRAKKHPVLVVSSQDPEGDATRANFAVSMPPEVLEQSSGHELTLGDVVLRIDRKPGECSGMYADVVRAGEVISGDKVRLD